MKDKLNNIQMFGLRNHLIFGSTNALVEEFCVFGGVTNLRNIARTFMCILHYFLQHQSRMLSAVYVCCLPTEFPAFIFFF